jgi:class 3 adenylate cyclase
VGTHPEIRYAKTPGGLSLSNMVLGDGPTDLLFFWQIPAALDACFEHPAHLRLWRFLSTFARVIGFDRRGMGASDPAPPESFADRHAWLEDATTVLDAVGAEKVVVMGEGFGGHAALAFAGAFPERTKGLVLVNSYARLVQDSDYPFGIPQEFVDDPAVLEGLKARWGTGEGLAESTPHLGNEPSFRASAGRFERMGASPATMAACIVAMVTSDVRDLLPSIEVPSLVLYTGDFTFVDSEHSRFLADHIKGATLIEAPVHSFWGFDPSSRNVVQEFISGIASELPFERELLTLVFTDIVSSTERLFAMGDAAWRDVIEDHDAYVRGEVDRHHGRVIKHTGDGHLATFSQPTDAIRTALRIRDAARVHGFEVRSGLHFGEVTIRSDGDVTGIVVNLAARVMERAQAGEVVVSRTITELVAGSGIEFQDRGEYELKGVPGSWRLFVIAP